MDLGDAGLALPLVLLVVIGGALLAGAAGMTWWRRRVETSPASPAAPAVVRQGANGFEQRLCT
ncbi:MAG TPA: hypothetical protein VHG52_12650, partial [Thermomicrobiales bacterium]|nr:hypothetical protein [Thermomicrobiales bacterium]